jgi:RimJ/RimL family protein N-acetyltransferase
MDEPSLTIRRLEPTDLPQLVAFLEREAASNLFHLANLEQLGIEHPDLRYYGVFHRAVMIGELMIYRRNAAVCWVDTAALAPLRDLLPREGVAALTGAQDQVGPLLDLLSPELCAERLPAIYARVTAETLIAWPARGERLATLDDLDCLSNLYAYNLLWGTQTRVEHRKRLETTLSTGGLVALIERDGLAVSAARTSAIGHGMAMIGGVVTLPAYRNQGYARAATGLLSRRLLERGIVPHLTYDPENAASARTYQRLGYQPAGHWIIAFLNPQTPVGSEPT